MRACRAVTCVAAVAVSAALFLHPAYASTAWTSGLSEFFRTVDKDGDGQIEPAEAMRYIGDSFGAELPESERNLAVQQMARNLDGSDTGVTVSKAEVEQHLRTLLKVQTLSSDPHWLCSRLYAQLWSCLSQRLQAWSRACMQGNRVSEWVKHAVGLPQYVETFRKNSITVILSLLSTVKLQSSFAVELCSRGGMCQ